MWHLLAQLDPHGGGGSDFWNVVDKVARTPLSQVLVFVGICTAIRLFMYPVLAKVPPHKRGGGYGFLRFFNEFLDAVIYAGVVVFMVIRPYGVQMFKIPSESMVPTLLVNDFIIANKAIYRYSEPQRGDIVVFKPPLRALDSDQTDVDFIKRLIGVPGDVIEVRDGVLYRNGEAQREPYLAKNYIDGDWKLVKYEGEARPDWAGKHIPVTMRTSPYGTTANWQTPTAREFYIGPAESDSGKSIPQSSKSIGELSPAEQRSMDELLNAPPAAVPPGHYLMMGDNRDFSYDSRGWGLVPEDSIVGRSEAIWIPFSRWRRTR